MSPVHTPWRLENRKAIPNVCNRGGVIIPGNNVMNYLRTTVRFTTINSVTESPQIYTNDDDDNNNNNHGEY